MIFPIPTFGEKLTGEYYQVRPGAYGLITKAAEKILVIQTNRGFFLPGGGIKTGETIENALIREIKEECGCVFSKIQKIGEAVDYLYAETESLYFAKHGHFYLIKNYKFTHPPIEKGPKITWLSFSEACQILRQPSHIWAVEQLILKTEKD